MKLSSSQCSKLKIEVGVLYTESSCQWSKQLENFSDLLCHFDIIDPQIMDCIWASEKVTGGQRSCRMCSMKKVLQQLQVPPTRQNLQTAFKPDWSPFPTYSFEQFFQSFLFLPDASDVDKSEGKMNSEGHPIQSRLFPGKVLGSIPVKLELQNGTGSGSQCSARKAGARCDTLSILWLPAATFMVASLKGFSQRLFLTHLFLF